MNQLITQDMVEALGDERTRIVKLCTALTGNAQAAEDLAQEVLLEAWRSIERLRDAEQFSHWLSGIARNVCLRWARKQGHTPGHLTQPQLAQDMPLEELLVADCDIEVELERKELVKLLNRALAMLPPVTRAVLIARYVEEASLAEVAERLDLQTGAVAMRLQRGKLALRRVLGSELGTELQEYGLPVTDAWEPMSVWCTYCGHHRLQGQFEPTEGTLILVCPACGEYSHSHLAHTSESDLFRGLKRVKPALSRLRGWMHQYYRSSLNTLAAPCLRCGRSLPLRIVSSLHEVDTAHAYEHWQDQRGVYQLCSTCQLSNWTPLAGLVLALPEGQRFLREHPRVRTLPEQQVEVDAQAAFVTRFESVTDQARFEVVSASNTYHLLRINGKHP